MNSLRSGWFGFLSFVWIVGIFLGSTFDYANSTSGAGMSYSTGTATFITNNATVLGIGTGWIAAMTGGDIKADSDDVWYRIGNVTDATHLTLASVYAQAGGAGINYTMAASAGWAGTGSGGYSNAPVSSLSRVMRIWKSEQKIPILGTIVALVTSSDFWKVIFQMILWRWTFMQDYELFYWVFCLPIVLMGIISMAVMLYQILTGNVSWS